MSYISSNLYLLSTSPSGVSQWQYPTTDTIGTVTGASYFADGAQQGMKPGDFIAVVVFTTYDPTDAGFSGFSSYNFCDVASISGVSATGALAISSGDVSGLGNAATVTAATEPLKYLTDGTPQLYKLDRSAVAVDSNGIFTTVKYNRVDGTLAEKSVLSSGSSPAYTTRTVTRYAANGMTVVSTTALTLTYDAYGNLITEA